MMPDFLSRGGGGGGGGGGLVSSRCLVLVYVAIKNEVIPLSLLLLFTADSQTTDHGLVFLL